jgi:hypothetical protein
MRIGRQSTSVSSNNFLRQHHGRLDGDANELLVVLEKGLPRLAATCLCRLWDPPGKDRHSLPALNRNSTFVHVAKDRDDSFVSDCNRLASGREFLKLSNFRNSDLAHNLTLAEDGEGFTVDELRNVVSRTHDIVDRLTTILKIQSASQKDIFENKRFNCDDFWSLVRPVIVKRA